MLIALILFLLLLLITVIIFAFPQFSPIPYFPSNPKDMPLIVKTLQLKNNQTVIDLGAGDGIVVFEAAKETYRKKLNTKFIAVDINPVLVIIMNVRRLFHPNRKSITILWADLFRINFRSLMLGYRKSKVVGRTSITVYLYVSPWFIERIVKHVKTQIKNPTFVTYFYPIPSLKKKEKKIQGTHSIYRYVL